MQIKHIIIIAAAVLAVIWAYFSSQEVVNKPTYAEEKLLPSLASEIQNVGTIVMRSKGKSFKVRYEDGNWVMPNKYNYKVDTQKIRDLVQNSANIKIIEKKDTPKEKFSELGLDDPENAASSAIRIVLLSGDEKTVYADYLRGLNRKGVSGTYENKEIYARLFSSDQAYLVNADLNFDLSAHTLLNGSVLNIKGDRIKQVKVINHQNASEGFTLARQKADGNDLEIIEPAGQKMKADSKASSIIYAMEVLVLEDIDSKDKFTEKKADVTVLYTTFNGMLLEVNHYSEGSDKYITLNAKLAGEDKASEGEVNKINDMAGNWVYKISAEHAGAFALKLSELVEVK